MFTNDVPLESINRHSTKINYGHAACIYQLKSPLLHYYIHVVYM